MIDSNKKHTFIILGVKVGYKGPLYYNIQRVSIKIDTNSVWLENIHKRTQCSYSLQWF